MILNLFTQHFRVLYLFTHMCILLFAHFILFILHFHVLPSVQLTCVDPPYVHSTCVSHYLFTHIFLFPSIHPFCASDIFVYLSVYPYLCVTICSSPIFMYMICLPTFSVHPTFVMTLFTQLSNPHLFTPIYNSSCNLRHHRDIFSY